MGLNNEAKIVIQNLYLFKNYSARNSYEGVDKWEL